MSSAAQTTTPVAGSWRIRLRRGFFKMSLREKALLLLFALAVLGVWFSWQLDRFSSTREQIAMAGLEANDQELFLDSAPQIQQNYDRLISQIDLQNLPTKDEVSSRVDALVRRFGFSSFDMGQARTEEGTGFYFHTLQLVIQKATYSQIKNFTNALKVELPFVSLERIVIQAQSREEQGLDVRFILKSIEHRK